MQISFLIAEVRTITSKRCESSHCVVHKAMIGNLGKLEPMRYKSICLLHMLMYKSCFYLQTPELGKARLQKIIEPSYYRPCNLSCRGNRHLPPSNEICKLVYCLWLGHVLQLWPFPGAVGKVWKMETSSKSQKVNLWFHIRTSDYHSQQSLFPLSTNRWCLVQVKELEPGRAWEECTPKRISLYIYMSYVRWTVWNWIQTSWTLDS